MENRIAKPKQTELQQELQLEPQIQPQLQLQLQPIQDIYITTDYQIQVIIMDVN